MGITVMVPNSLGPAELLMHYGTEAQKNHYLPLLARGEEILSRPGRPAPYYLSAFTAARLLYDCTLLEGPESGSTERARNARQSERAASASAR